MASVDDRVVSIKFDNKDFEKKVTDTVGSIDKLNKSLNFESAKKSISDLSGAAKSIDFSGLGGGIDAVTAKFSAMSAVGFAAINNIVTSAINAGKSIASGLSVDQVNSGLKEYEMNLNSIQTILANTKSKGTTLDQVNVALDELNKYSDLTIYNFADMTKAISQFTAAGVSMDTAVPSIKGVANLAAISGTNNVEAARAMGQLAQAVSSGSLKLRDWMSVDSAGMGGEVFKMHLLQTASAMGTIKKIKLGTTIQDWEKANGSFRDSLESGWITADVLTTSLKGLAGELSTEQLQAIGYTKEQAAAVIELGKTGMAAATEVKTLSGLFDTVKQAVGSGWSETFKNIFGNFDEAKSTFTAWNNVLGAIVGNTAKKRNDFLESFKEHGGRANIIDGINLSFLALLKLIAPIKEAFRDIFPKKTVAQAVMMSQQFKRFAKSLVMSAETAEKVRNVFRGIFAVLGIGFTIIKAVAGVIFGLAKAFSNAVSGPTLSFFSKLGNILYGLFKIISGAKVQSAIFAAFGNVMRSVGKAVSDATAKIRKGLDAIDLKFLDRFKAAWIKLKNALSFGKKGDKGGAEESVSFFDRLAAVFGKIGNGVVAIVLGLANALAKVANAVSNFVIKIDFAKKIASVRAEFAKLTAVFDKLFGGVKGAGSKAADGAKTGFELLSKAGSRLAQVLMFVAKIVGGVVYAFYWVGKTIGKVLGDIWNVVIEQFKTAKFSNIIDLMNTGLFAGLLLLIKRFMKNGLAGMLGGDNFMKKIQGLLKGLEDAIKSFSMNLKASALYTIAKAIGVLALSLWLLSLVPSEKLATSMATLAVGLAGMVSTLDILANASKDKSIDAGAMFKMAATMAVMAAGLLLFSGSVAVLGRMDPEALAKGVLASAVLMAAMAASIRLLTQGKKLKDEEVVSILKQGVAMLFMGRAISTIADSVVLLGNIDDKKLVKGMIAIGAILGGLFLMIKFLPDDAKKKIGGMFALSVAIRIIADAVTVLGNMDPEKLFNGITAIAIILAALSLMVKTADPKQMVTVGTGLAGLAVALLIIAAAVKIFGDMDTGKLFQGIEAVLILLVALTAAMVLIGMSGPQGATAMLLAAAAIMVLAVAIKILAEIPFEIMMGAIFGIATVLALVTVAALLLAPAIPVITAFATALALLGAAGFGIGLAFLGIGLGLYFVSKAGSGAIDTLINLIGRVITLIPDFIKALLTGFIDSFTTILDAVVKYVPMIIELVIKLVVQLFDALIKIAPKITEFITRMIQIVIDVITQKVPEIVKMGVILIKSFLNGIKANIKNIVDTILEIMNLILKGIENAAGDLAKAGGDIIVAIIHGLTQSVSNIAQAIRDLIVTVIEEIGKNYTAIILAGVALVVTFLKAMSTATVQIANGIGEFVVAIIMGLTKAIAKYAPRIKFAFGQMIAVALDQLPGAVKAILDFIGLDLPKVKTPIEIDKVEKGWREEDLADVAKQAANEAQAVLNGNKIVISGSVNLDTTAARMAIAALQKDPIGVLAPGTTRMLTPIQAALGVVPTGSTSNVINTTTINQTNISPNPLNASDVYKNTKSAVAIKGVGVKQGP